MNINPRRADERYRLGHMNQLKVLRIVSIGAYLDWVDDQGILLPLRYLPENIAVGDTIDVFVYHDNEGRPIATTLKPHAFVGEVAYLECVSLSQAGAFMEWGIHKDLFVPFAEQRGRMEEGKRYPVVLYIDHVSGKIVGSAKLNKHIGNSLPTYQTGEEVRALVVESNDVGCRCVVDHRHWGMIYMADLKQALRRGEVLVAYVRRIREDGRIDLSVRPVGYDRTEGDSAHLLSMLHQSGGRLPIGDKSPAEEILRLTGLSKKSFKMAVGALYKQRKITLTPESITLAE